MKHCRAVCNHGRIFYFFGGGRTYLDSIVIDEDLHHRTMFLIHIEAYHLNLHTVIPQFISASVNVIIGL